MRGDIAAYTWDGTNIMDPGPDSLSETSVIVHAAKKPRKTGSAAREMKALLQELQATNDLLK